VFLFFWANYSHSSTFKKAPPLLQRDKQGLGFIFWPKSIGRQLRPAKKWVREPLISRDSVDFAPKNAEPHMYGNVAEILDKLSDFGCLGFIFPQSLCPFCMVSFFAMEFSIFSKTKNNNVAEWTTRY
jgi:hypothetical protein